MSRPQGKVARGEAGTATAGEERVRVRSRWRHLPPGPAATIEDDAQLPDVTEAFKQYLGKQRKASTRALYVRIVSKLFGQHHRSLACMGTSNSYYAFVEESNRGHKYALKWFRSFWAVRSSRLTKQGQTRKAPDAEAKPGSDTAEHTEDHAEKELKNEVSFELQASAAQAPDAEAKPGSDTAKHTEDHAEKELKNEVSFELKTSAAHAKVGREQEDELGPSGDVQTGLLQIEQPSGMPAPTTPPAIPSRSTTQSCSGHKHARSESFHGLTGQIVRVDWSRLKTIRPKELPAIEDLFPADTETLTSAELRHYEKQLKWHTKRTLTERLEKLSKELQTNSLPWASPASQSNEASLGPQAFLNMAADERLQLRSEELKHLEQQMLILDGEHLTVQERRDRLRDHVRKLAGAATHKEKQLFMQQWLDTAESTRFGVTIIDDGDDAPGLAAEGCPEQGSGSL